VLSTEQIVDAKFLSVCPPTEAVQWLRAARSGMDKLKSLSRKDYSHQEQTLASRNDPYIDFGLARYGTSEAAGKEVYDRGDLGIRCAYLAHFPGGGFNWIGNTFELASKPPQALEELCALVTNPNLDDEVFKACFEKRGIFAGMSHEEFQTILIVLSDSKRLVTPYDDTFMDGYADYSYHKVFEAAWNLALTVPASTRWASVLYHLLYRCLPPRSDFDANAAIVRWRLLPQTKADKISDYGFYLRSRLADLLRADNALLTSKDAALRTSFYRRFDPRAYSVWPDFVSDGEHFLDNALHNKLLWQSPEVRDALNRLCWDHPDPHARLDMPNAYKAIEARMLEEHPQWFAN
jgi:hypothetical protein